MNLPFTSVVSYHTSEYGCGVAKFGKQLAERLGVPFVPFTDVSRYGAHPLLSLKWSEVRESDDLPRVWGHLRGVLPFSLFWHDGGSWLTTNARHVFYADASLGSPSLWCPSLLTPSPRPVKLFSFGMAGRIQLDHYEDVKALLQIAGNDYRLRVSCGLHEGTSLSDAMSGFDELRDLMGRDNVTFLGILSDDALIEEILAADYVLSFFKDGVKANNTTVHAALDAGAKVITNGKLRDAIDLEDLHRWPGRPTAYSWDNLISAMRKECDKSKSLIA